MALSFLLIPLFAVLCLSQTPPVWPPQFEIAFDEHTTTGKTTGKIIYDAKNNR